MTSNDASPNAIDDYIAAFPPATQALLQQMRATIRAAAPDAQETISYKMPAFAQAGMLVYFAPRANYIGFYPTGSGIEAFKEELAPYWGTKGSAHFPFDQPLPTDLITRIVRFRVAENLARAAKPPKSPKSPKRST